MSWRKIDYAGRWEMIDKKQILLKFNEITDPSILLASGTIGDSVKEVRFINKNKMIMDGYTILKRQK